MHAFEDLVARLLRREGFWTRHSVKVTLSAEDKQRLGKPSLPRPELDLLAYQPKDNVLALVECKSYLDSSGVSITSFDGKNRKSGERYRLFTDEGFREIVTKRVVEQLASTGAVSCEPDVRYWLIAGHIAAKSVGPLHDWFDGKRDWELRGRTWIAESLQAMRQDAYEDDIVTMAMKLSVDP